MGRLVCETERGAGLPGPVVEPTAALVHNPVGLVHTAVYHRTPGEMAATLAPFVDDALQMGDQVYANLPPASLAALKGALGRQADRVRWSDSTRWNPHPTRRLRAIRELVEGAERHGTGRLRLLGDCPLPPAPDMVVEWERFDALLNHALAGMPATVVCLFDQSSLPGDVVDRAPWSHPFVGVDPLESSPCYLAPDQYLSRHRVPAAPAPEGAPSLSGAVQAGDARDLVRRAFGPAPGTGAPVPPEVVEDMALAVTELVTNSWQAGARSVAVTCWRLHGEAGAQVADDGPGLGDPLAGYRRPGTVDERGRGLWMARQLVDVLDVQAGASGTSVRIRTFDAAWT